MDYFYIFINCIKKTFNSKNIEKISIKKYHILNGHCRDTIFNDPRMTLGSYINGPNNMICREWVWKGLPLGTGQGSDPGFMRTHTKVGWDCIAEPYVDVVRKVWLLGFSSRSLTFSPLFLLFFSAPHLPCSLSLLY